MNQIENNAFFWQKLDTIYNSSHLLITRGKNTCHPNYHNLIYPVDYGYLEDTDKKGSEVCAFKGSLKASSVQVIVIAADILKKDIEVKLLIGCTEEEEKDILLFLNQTDFQKTVLIRRANTIPNWGVTE